MTDEDIDFKKAMEGVRRLKKGSPPPARPKQPARNAIRTRIQCRAVESALNIDQERAPRAANETLGQCNETDASELFFLRQGLQNKILRDLKKGKRYPIETVVDLHGLNQTGAQSAIDQSIATLLPGKLICLLIIHGKGLRSTQGPVLKIFTSQYLKTLLQVKAYCSAQIRDGGTGALYVLVRPMVAVSNSDL